MLYILAPMIIVKDLWSYWRQVLILRMRFVILPQRPQLLKQPPVDKATGL